MSPKALLLLFACPVTWAMLDLLRKHLAAYGRAVPMTFLIVAAQIPPLLVWTSLEGRWDLHHDYWWPALASLAINILANLAYMQAVRLSPMSATLPLLSLTPVFATLLGIPLLGEVPSPRAASGILVVVFGAALLNSEAADGLSPRRWLRALRREPGSGYMIGVALLWSAAPLLDKLAVRHAAIGVHALVLTVGIAGALLVVLAYQGRLAEAAPPHGARATLMVTGLVAVAALALQLWVIQLVWVGLVETVKRGIGAVTALLVGRFVFGEALPVRRRLAVVTMVVGVWLVVV